MSEAETPGAPDPRGAEILDAWLAHFAEILDLPVDQWEESLRTEMIFGFGTPDGRLFEAGYRKGLAAEARAEPVWSREASDLLYLAWGVIANANHGDWTGESAEWQEAAGRWREQFHAYLAAYLPVEPDRARESGEVE